MEVKSSGKYSGTKQSSHSTNEKTDMAWAYFKQRGNTREMTGFRKDSRKHQQEDKILGKRGGNIRERTRYWERG